VSGSNMVGVSPLGFGFSGFSAPLLGEAGVAESQAGEHPYELPVKIDLNSAERYTPEGALRATSVRDVRDVVVDLPLGVAGSAVSAPTCTLHQLSAEGEAGKQGVSSCPADTIVGYLRSFPEGFISASSPIYNIVPERGVAAELGYVDSLGDSHVIYASIAPTGEGYVLRSTTREIPQVLLDEITADVYGDPAARDKAHLPQAAMFTNPEDCTGQPLTTSVYMDSWQAPGAYNPDGTPDLEGAGAGWVKATYESPPVTGCEQLAGLFAPEAETIAESSRVDNPTGLQVNIKVPQQESESLSTPPVREISVTLPEGMTVNPSSANGLEACSEAQIGWQGKTPAEPGELEDFNAFPAEASQQEEEQAGQGVAGEPARCPKASRIGSVEVESPALPAEACKGEPRPLRECAREEPAGVFPEREKTPLLGSVYLARQYENPFGSLIAAYFVIDDPRTGVIVKLPGEVQLNEATGRITTIVKDAPQFPFSELRTHIFGGARASLSTPATCGSYSLATVLTPWSHEPGPGETTGTPDGEPQSGFAITEGVDGGGCPASLAFAPAFSGGSVDSQAAAFSPLNVSIVRQDDEQELGGVSVTTPPGLSAILKSVTECPEPQAGDGDCGPESLIGEATTVVGAGTDPYTVHGGEVYLTGPYNNGPFGLSIVVPTTAGPFTLTGVHGGYGKEVVRSSIRINPTTAQATVVSDAIPPKIQGIPLQIRAIDISINRPGFAVNPTSCAPLSMTATITSTQGASSSPSTPFHAANCASLPFKPSISVSTSSKSSKTDGDSLLVKLAAKPGEANVAKTDLTIPTVLPARLMPTLQHACTEAQFGADPAGCPEESVIGMATVDTPVLNVPLTGPIYIVSHGGAAFPDVEMVLQGEGVEIVLDGKTDIKKGITYSDFEAVPDAPFSSFEADLPAGPHSIFTTEHPGSTNLCGRKLTIPSRLVGQNGAEIKQDTHIEVTGCPHTVSIQSHSVKKRTLTLSVIVPGAGKLTATGKGVSKATKSSSGPETVTMTLRQKKAGKLLTRIMLSFIPKTGKKLTKDLTVKFK
jgi:hypothetical protein